MTQLSCTVSSLTPIVTGDHDHRNTELLATGILGSLRYQYWLLKAMQAWQADPQRPAYPRCSADLPAAGSKCFAEELHKAGPVIWLFGATNWKKMFRLEIADAVQGKQQPCSARANDRIAPWTWNFKLIFRQDRESPIFDELAEKEGFCLEKELRSLMAFVHHYGWLGAAPQNGLGWVKVQGKGLERTALREDNPVFSAKDIELSAECIDNLLVTLRKFYVQKLEDAERKLSAVERRLEQAEIAKKDYLKDKEWKNQHGRKTRYDQSLHLLNQKNKEFPIGYEIRRWLKDQIKQFFFFGDENQAGFVHITHPDVQEDGSWRVRMRFTVRPDGLGGVNPPFVKPPPNVWLSKCERLLFDAYRAAR